MMKLKSRKKGNIKIIIHRNLERNEEPNERAISCNLR